LKSFSPRTCVCTIAALLASLLAPCVAGQALDEQLLDQFEFRSIGPSVFGGRIVDIELLPDQPFTVYVASASGGLWKTLNNGTTWTCIFQDEGTISIGDIAVQPDNPDVIWVGTGEANNQRSSYWGDGIYKTTDGGQTWTNTGLPESHHIGRIVIHPENPDIVYVAALGHLYTPNEKRGLYKTTDGGQTWEKVLYVNDDTGVTDVVLDPSNPDTIFAASYERRRRAWHFDGAGPGSGIWKSTDAGETWKRLEGGLPSGDIGRIGLAIYHDDPKIIYATVSNQNPEPSEDGDTANRLGFQGELTEDGFTVTDVAEEGGAAQAGIEVGDVIVRIGDVTIDSVWSLIKALGATKDVEEVEVEYRRGEQQQTVNVALGDDGVERDIHGIARNQIGGEIYRSDDRGETWTRMNERSIGGTPPYYYGQIRIDPTDPDRIYVLSVPLLVSSDGGKTWERGNLAGSVHVDHHALEIGPHDPSRLVLGNDGGLAISYDRGETWDHYANLPFSQFYAVGVDTHAPYHVYGGTQDNGTWGGPSTSRHFNGIQPEEWYRVGGGDGFYAQIDPTDSNIVYGESQFGGVYRFNKATGERTSIRPREPDDSERYRFNWNSPILISHHNPEIIYFGGNRLFKSLNRGDSWPIRSPDLTTADEDKIAGNVPHCTITTIAESPIDPNLLLVGTDDGMVQLSEDGGVTWTNLAGRFPDVPANWWVSRVVLSRHDVDTAYVSFTGYREDDFRPFVYVSRNRGKNWQRISNNLPKEPVNVVHEDPRNANVLYVGTEMGAYVSIDAGATWNELDAGLPTIPVHDLVVHARDRDLILATHGRGFYIADIAAIQDLSADVLAKEAHLFSVEDAHQWNFIGGGLWSGDRHRMGENAPYGATISYHLRSEAPEGQITLQIEDVAGKVVRHLDAPRKAGLHRVIWDFRGDPPEGENDDEQRRRRRRAPMLGPGAYTAVLTVGDETRRESFLVRRDPMLKE